MGTKKRAAKKKAKTNKDLDKKQEPIVKAPVPKARPEKKCPIIGITGRAGCGKGTVADYLSAYYGYRGTSFATPLKRAVAEIFCIPVGLAFTEVRELKEGELEPWGLSPRRMAQLLGTEVGRNIDPQVWVKNMDIRTKEYRDLNMGIVIDDVRFDNEAEWVRANGGRVFHLDRPSEQDGTKHTTHASEAGVTEMGEDIIILNNGTLEDLYSMLDDVMEGEALAWKLTFKHEEDPRVNTEKGDLKPPPSTPYVQPPVYDCVRHVKREG